ncbi:MAG: hypothetical protein AB1631_23350 [Acidobacteriota bacterium]
MRLSIHKPAFIKLAMVFILSAGLSGCWPTGPSPEPENKSSHYVICVDNSRSLTPVEQEQWKAPPLEVIKRLAAGDAVTILRLHDNTRSAAIFTRRLRTLPDGAGHQETTEIHNQWKQVRAAAQAELEDALAPRERSNSTDILSAFNLISREGGQRTVVIFLSDMLHSTDEFDLERSRTSESGLMKRVSEALAKRHLRRGALQGVKVYCLLNSVGINQARPLNDRNALREFWASVCGFLGAEIMSFDANLSYDLLTAQTPDRQ